MAQRTIVAGRYSLISPLGRGGMGQVWEGRDERLGRAIAVKLLTEAALAGQAGTDEAVRRFTREAAVTAGLDHPGVPAIYDAGKHDGDLYLVMELIDGCTVGDLVAEHGPLPIPWVVAVGAQVAAVLAVAHGGGVVHRDIKPQNVMITRGGAAKVLDFGVASLFDQRITSSGVAVGTPAYMAPEQLNGLPATPRTDLYALGCLLYEMLAGEPVFTAASPAGLMRAHLDQTPAPLRRHDLSPWLASLVRQLLDKDPARRPADARVVCDRLLPFVERLGPLGDIDPVASGGGADLYSLLRVRISGMDPAVPGPPWPQGWPSGPPAGSPSGWPGEPPPAGSPYLAPGAPGPRTWPNARRTAGWTFVHSLWLLPTLAFGLGTWIAFGYIGIRHQRLRWLLVGVIYLILEVVAFVLVGSAPDNGNGPTTLGVGIGLLIGCLVWLGGFVHAMWVNFTARLPLRAGESA